VNNSIISYMLEGPVAGRTNFLFLAHNTVVNEGPSELEGSPSYFLIRAKAGYSGLILNNIFAGPGILMPEEPRANFEIRDNLVGEDPRLVAPSLGDYRLQDNPPAAGKAGPIPPDLADLLAPLAQYQPPASAQRRTSAYPASLGAFELGTAEANFSSPCSLSSPLDFAWISPSLSTLTIKSQ
jgi:hypothetical protein